MALWLQVVLIFTLAYNSNGYQSGAPQQTCEDLTPRHRDFKPQSSPSPYGIATALQRVTEGNNLRIFLNSPTGETFKGFIVQARTPDGVPLGSFTNIPDFAKTMTCGNGLKNTLTHKDSTEKSSLELEWEPPADYEGPVLFNSTFVKDGATFWVGVESNKVQVVRRSVGDKEKPAIGISTTKIPIRVTTQPTYTAPKQIKGSQTAGINYDGCGDTKTCFGLPGDCVSEKSCGALVTVMASPSPPYDFTFELFALLSGGSGYVAVGLSDDDKMGDDVVMECTSNKKAFTSVNHGTQNTRIGDDDPVSSSFIDNLLYCQLTRPAKATVEKITYDLINKKYFLLLAVGNIDVSTDKLKYHGPSGRVASSTSLQLNQASIAGAASDLIYRLHGAFMIAAWIGFAGTGMLVARYFKKTWVNAKICGKDIWFAWHRAFMIGTWVLTIVGFVIIFVEEGGWYGETSNPHAVLGCITTGLAFIQPIAANFRPGPGTPKRPLFNWSHWFLGNLAHLLAVITIFFAIELSKAELPKWNYGVVSAYVAFHVIMHIFLSISDCSSEKQSTQRVNNMQMNDISGNLRTTAYPEKRDAPHSPLRKFLLGVYLVVVIGLTVALIVIVVLAPIEDNEVVKTVMNYVVPANST